MYSHSRILRNIITLRVKSYRLNSLGFCSDAVAHWIPGSPEWLIPSYSLPNVPDILVAHSVQSSFLDPVQAQGPGWGGWGCLTFDGGFVVSYLFSGSWRLMEKEGKHQGQWQNVKAIPINTQNSERKNFISVLKAHSCPYHSIFSLISFWISCYLQW